MLMEWGYEVPLLLQSLLIDGGFVAGNIYNTHTDPENFGLYYNTKKGIKNIKRFYEFIEKHQAELIDDLEAFSVAKESLFNFLNKLKQPYLHVDAWDVFNMSDESHENQANDWLKNIAQNNQVITNAIEQDDIALLDFSLFTRETGLGFSDFKSLLNYPDYNYGWAHIFDGDEQEEELEIYEENGLWGLKSAKDKVLIEPYFDEFYGFGSGTFAVVAKGDKFGYVDKSGKIVIPLIYEDAYDFEGDYAVIQQDGKKGLITLKGEIKLMPGYEDLYTLAPYNQFYCAQLNSKYGIINMDGAVILPFDFENEFEEKGWGEIYFVKEKGKGARLIYSRQFNLLGRFDPLFIETKHIYGSETDLYMVSKHKYQDVNVLLSGEGEVLVDGFEKIAETLNDALIIRKHKKFGLFKCKNGLVLNFDFDLITDLNNNLDVPISTYFNRIPDAYLELPFNFLKVVKDHLCGVYLTIGNFEEMVVPIIYEDIKAIKNEFIAVQKNGFWGVLDITGKQITAIEYDEVINLISYSGIAYGLKDGNVYAITKDDVVYANKYHLQDYVDANGEYGYYYFSTAIQKKIQVYIDRD